MEKITAVILAGGKGTRLQPYTFTVPKPLLPLGNTAVLEIVLAQLSAAGLRRVILTLGYLPRLFQESIGDGSRWDLSIDYFCEEKPLGTAGSLRLLSELSEDFIVMNGDLLTTIDYSELLTSHRDSRAMATIAVHRRKVKIDYGVIHTNSEGFLKEYSEKPILDYRVSMGIYVLNKTSVSLIPAERRFDMPELMTAVSENGGSVYCYEPGCYWQDIGRPDDYHSASQDFEREPARFLPQ